MYLPECCTIILTVKPFDEDRIDSSQCRVLRPRALSQMCIPIPHVSGCGWGDSPVGVAADACVCWQRCGGGWPPRPNFAVGPGTGRARPFLGFLCLGGNIRLMLVLRIG